MAAVIGELRPVLAVPFGVDLLWDPLATLAVGKAVGAAFVREVFIGVYESDMGQLRPDPGAAFAYRHSIGADDIAIFTNLTPEFASPLGTRTVADRAQGARFFGCSARAHLGPARGLAVQVRRPGGGEGGRAGDAGDGQHRRPPRHRRAHPGDRRRHHRRHRAEGRRRAPRTASTWSAPSAWSSTSSTPASTTWTASRLRPQRPREYAREPGRRRRTPGDLAGVPSAHAAGHPAPGRYHRAGGRRDRQRGQRATRRRRRRRRGHPPRGGPRAAGRVPHARRLSDRRAPRPRGPAPAAAT